MPFVWFTNNKRICVTTKKKIQLESVQWGYDCEKISIEKLKHFVSKEAFNIDGFEKNCRKFLKLNLIKYPQDIFRLDYKKIEHLEGWGKLSVDNLKYS